MTLKRASLLAIAAACLFATAASAQVKVGVTVSATGPAASLGIPEKNTFTLLPRQIGGKTVEYIVLDDASDTTTAVKNTRKLISEDKVDVVVGSTVTPNSLAMIDIAAENETPMITMAASARLIEPMDSKRAWVFKTPQNDSHMATAIAEHMTNHNVKTVAFIGFADAYGDSWAQEFAKVAELRKIRVVANERFARTDTSVTGQVLKMLGSNADAVLIAGSGTPAALPAKTLKERGYKGKIYQTHGAATPDLVRIGGKDVEGSYLVSGPAVMAEQLPDSHPSKMAAMEFVTSFEKAYGPGTRNQFAGHAHDARIVLEKALPAALKKAKPGTPEFRAALRDALENMGRTVVAHGVINWTASDHSGYTNETGVILKVVDGKFMVEK